MARSTAPLLTILVALVASFISIYTKQPQAFLFATLSTSNVTGPETPESRPSVYNRLNDVTYIGSSVSGVEHFQNIFYAEDTSGLNRFAPPVPYSPTPGSVIDATQAGAWCPQGTGAILPFTSKVVNVSENCLSLRIARPHNAKKDTKLPVLVWLHGGMSPCLHLAILCGAEERITMLMSDLWTLCRWTCARISFGCAISTRRSCEASKRGWATDHFRWRQLPRREYAPHTILLALAMTLTLGSFWLRIK